MSEQDPSAEDIEAGDEPDDLDPMSPDTWYREAKVCGSCIAWRPGEQRDGDKVATGVCRLRPELGRVPASLKLCDLYKQRGQYVYQPSSGSGRRKRTARAKVLVRGKDGETRTVEPGPLPVRPRPPRPPAPKDIDLGEESVPVVKGILVEVLREEFGRSKRELASKYRSGKIRVIDSAGRTLEHKPELLFAMLDRLQTCLAELERAVGAQSKLGTEREAHQALIRRIRGSLTTFNVLYAHREDQFSTKA